MRLPLSPDTPYAVVRLEDIAALPAPWTSGVDWRPVRFHLDLRAFGINAYTAERAGAELIEPHSEQGAPGGGHQELYVVLTGRARFTLDGREIEAGAGTLVAARDPAVKRAATALEDGTTVLAIGGPTGAAFEVSSWEYVFRAYGASRQGTPADAVAIVEEGLRQHPEEPSLLYQLACYEALSGAGDEALAHLQRAAALDPKYAEHARTDSDLESIRDRPGFPRSAPAP